MYLHTMHKNMPLLPDFTSFFLRNSEASFPAHVCMLTRAGYAFHGCLIVNPEREMKLKIAVTVGLQDINSMYITEKTKLVFILNALILLASSLEIVVAPNVYYFTRSPEQN